MSMTKKTITVFTGNIPNPMTDVDFSIERTEFVQSMLDAGKTDSLVVTPISENTFQRNWLDQAAADEFLTFFNEATQRYNFVQTTTIENL